VFSDISHTLHSLAHGLIGFLFAAIVVIPSLIARRVDLNAEEPKPTEER
jgi:hypothetical protein